ncbi:ArnT family glycosyltransferase [Pontibacter vulgaris]|uniref:ArnT family glycosyltransferase n=1 Tax=Pontibacter vulgaris TaxID=2905679 RepID=UPI001FA6B7DD|nr:glycosyltransferase family 39 protein [Pontibacter vulgaris]
MLKQNDAYGSRTVLLLLTILLAILLYNLGGWGVIETSEARYAEISREMLATGHWLHPRLLGILHFHKPPVTYIITAWGMAAFGVTEFGARFFLQLSLVLQAWLVYKMGLELFKAKRPAFFAVVAYISMPAVLISARNLTTDSFLTTFELLAIWAWLCYKNRNSPGWLYLYFATMALAFLTKGPVGIIFPVLVAIAYRPVTGLLHGKAAHIFTAFTLFLLLSASWYVYLMWQEKQFVDYFLLKHTVQRYANPETFGRSKPWWFYLVLAPALSLPWSALVAFSAASIKQMPKLQSRLLLIWLLVPLVFFSLSGSKLILYILPLFAGLALLAGYTLQALPPERQQKATFYTCLYFAILALALLAVPLAGLGIEIPIWALLFPVAILASLAFILRSSKDPGLKFILATLAFTLLLIPYSTYLLGHNPDKTNSSTSLVTFLRQKQLANRPLLVYDELLPSLAFELKRNIVTVQDKNRKLTRETQFESDTTWRQHYLQLSNKQDEARLRNLVQQEAVLITGDELLSERVWLIKSFKHKQQVGKWRVYY